jgi:dTMP kinase
MINSYLQSKSELDDRAIHLLFSANRWELAYVHPSIIFLTARNSVHTHGLLSSSKIESLLASGTIVICDRYAFSGIAFSAAKGLSYAWCRSPDINLPSPDLTLFLDVSPDIARQRGGYGEERYEKEEMQRKVAEVFRRIGKEISEDGGRWVGIDAGQGRGEVSSAIWEFVEPIKDGIEQPVQKLWTGYIDQ